MMKVALYKCDNYPNCSSCLGSGNPYCGWCSLENKCSLRAECQEYTQALRWLPYKGQTCPSITSVTPQQIQKKQKSTELQLNVSNQPYFSGTYQCVFRYEKNTASYNILTTNTTLPPNNAAGIKCETPEDYKLPPIPTGEDHINMTLAVQIRGREFVSTIFTFFDCSKHESCTKCSMTQFPCTWCIENHQCTHDASVNCRTNHLIHGSSNLGLTATDKVGPLMCPRVQLSVGSIKQDPEDRRKIYVPSGTAKKVTMFGYNLYPFMQDIRCFFSFGQGHDVKARVVDGNIECDEVSFIYSDKSEFLNVQLRINWRMNGSGKELPLDNPTNVQVVVYKCNEMASTCGDCISKNDNFSCGWCKDTKTCTINLQCPATDWLHAGTCPNVEITKFFPLTGPKAGGTKLTILGKNLGIEKKDISGGVSVAGVACNPIEEEYVPPSKIVCRTGRMGDRTAGPVKVVIGREFEDYSSDTFSYVDPVIREIKPGKGPMAGGTRVQLGGSDLDAGSNVHVKIGDIECENINRSQLILSCVTKASITNDSYLVSARFDNQNVSTTLLYEYIMNPNVTGVSPIKGIVSGGIEIHVRGTNLEYVQQAVMVFKEYTPMDRRRRSIKEYYGECIIPKQDEQYMVCYSPKISNNSLPDDRMQGAKFTYGIKLDNIFIDRTKDNKEMFTIYPDPEFPEPFERSYQSKIDNYLTIDGKYLNLGFNTSDIVVKIGSGFCNVTSIDKNGNQLNCKPPPPSPSGGNPSIEVFVGRNFTRKVGSLHYEVAEVLPASLIIGLGVGGGVLVIGVVFFVVLWCIKSRENMNMKKKWQIQMDSLEVKVAKECREAFAELQTDMTELTNDQLGQIAIPFWDYRTYCMRVLFPADEDTHPVLRELDVAPDQREQMENGLKQFANLISNRTFLLVFVRTLEGHKKFNMRERVNVASLISVALQTKMEYATDILKTLLAELIEKSVEGKNHPKLLLRRTESIAEKMLTNWFTFLLYKFLKECAGEPLFMLYQAIKQQMSKGPVDSITSEARYSLSEDKLIRQHVDYKPMTVNILDMEQFGQQSHPVKVLDCDTISQVKEKILDAIYKNAPFSSRPTKQQVDLVLLSGQPGDPDFNPKLQVKTILSDIDSSTKVEGDFKRFNTLAHYKVADQACMVLRPKQVPSLPDITVATVKSFDYRRFDNETYGSRSPALSRAATTRGGHGDIEMAGLISGTKTYHLVKQHDQESNKEGDRGSKMVSEIYLTRLLATKGTLQQFVDDLFERIFSTSHRGTCLPLAIKYMFDFLDDQALLHNIQDQDVVHTWKSNSLPLRFWVNVIKNPNFVFDIYKSNIVDSCLSVVAQNFMDSCSMSDHKLSKDSPSSKLLYAKDIPTYKKWVDRYYHDIKMMPAISDQDITAMMNEESRSHSEEFNTSAALYELYKYVEAYNDDLITALEDDEFARNYRLIQKLESVHVAMRGSSSC
ncbi:hypothetical protein DPMN_129893 [Dreissena polymorpha]|uniref:Plexin A n=1 Tax=Dreissena polymorpha TaxID=45954 RepID=A0A9D4K0Y7_DREPO|nr:hypothetical protein DPMN_129893 [Dreissena polymorpha]